MSLQYIIDGYNIINHAEFKNNCPKSKVSQYALAKLIKNKRLCGKNRSIIVFDGYPPNNITVDSHDEIEMVFSKDLSADEKIKNFVERARNPKNIVVVSDDNEVRLIAKVHRAGILGVEEFISPNPKNKKESKQVLKPELTFSQMHKINEELKKIWLK